MALFSKDTVIASVGVSCQTAMQIGDQQEFIASLLGEDVRVKNTSFDWLLSGQKSCYYLLKHVRFFPETVEELEVNVAPFWKKANVHYLHERDPIVNFEAVRDKFLHTTARFMGIKKFRRKIFILSNTQNNLVTFEKRIGRQWFFLDEEGVQTIRNTLAKRFGDVELYIVTYADRHALLPSDDLFVIEKDSSNVRGDHAQWTEIFRSIILRPEKRLP